MNIPVLSKDEVAALKHFSTLSDTDLYAMLGERPTYKTLRKKEDSLGLMVEFRLSRQTIARGKKRIKKILDQSKEDLCKKWAEVKKQHSDKIENTITIALIIEVARPYIIKELPQGFPPVVAIAELIWRLTERSLDRFCKLSE